MIFGRYPFQTKKKYSVSNPSSGQGKLGAWHFSPQ
jgi:hypothetical protein